MAVANCNRQVIRWNSSHARNEVQDWLPNVRPLVSRLPSNNGSAKVKKRKRERKRDIQFPYLKGCCRYCGLLFLFDFHSRPSPFTRSRSTSLFTPAAAAYLFSLSSIFFASVVLFILNLRPVDHQLQRVVVATIDHEYERADGNVRIKTQINSFI